MTSAHNRNVGIAVTALLVFGVAGGMLVLSGIMLWNARRLPCPTDPQLARSCMRLRSISNRLWAVAAIAYAAGVIFAFLLPAVT